MLAALFGIVCGVCGYILGKNDGRFVLLKRLANTKEISIETFKNEMKKLL